MTLLEDVRSIRHDLDGVSSAVDVNAASIAKLQEQIGGERGISAALNAQTREIANLRKAAYWVGGLIIAGSLSFAFSVLLLIH
jgi:hypothetical protein